MKTRVLSGLAMTPLLIVIYMGGYVLAGFCFLLSFFALREFYKAFEGVAKPSYPIGYVCCALLYLLTFFINAGYFASPVTLWLFISVTLCLLMLFRPSRSLKDAALTLAGLVYVVLFLFHLYLIAYYYSSSDTFIQGFDNFAWLVVLSAFGSDIFAYFTGVLIGRHKLAPLLSPKKTVEGSIGGILGSTLACALFAWFVMRDVFILSAVIGVLGGAFSQIGDIAASAIKRQLDIKDFGHLIPGHGGLLDRIDSILFTAPLVYYSLSAMSYIYML